MIQPSGPVNQLPAFQPVLIPPSPQVAGLRIFIGPPTAVIAGFATINNVDIAVPTQFVNVGPLSITYVYLDLTSGLIATNTSGFSGAIYQIAIVGTNATEVTTLTDVRPDVMVISGGGGGGTGPDTIISLTVPSTISQVLNENIFATIVAGASPTALPPAAGVGGQTIKIIKTDTGSSNTITGAASGSYFLTAQFQYVVFESNVSSWYVVGNN